MNFDCWDCLRRLKPEKQTQTAISFVEDFSRVLPETERNVETDKDATTHEQLRRRQSRLRRDLYFPP